MSDNLNEETTLALPKARAEVPNTSSEAKRVPLSADIFNQLNNQIGSQLDAVEEDSQFEDDYEEVTTPETAINLPNSTPLTQESSVQPSTGLNIDNENNITQKDTFVSPFDTINAASALPTSLEVEQPLGISKFAEVNSVKEESVGNDKGVATPPPVAPPINPVVPPTTHVNALPNNMPLEAVAPQPLNITEVPTNIQVQSAPPTQGLPSGQFSAGAVTQGADIVIQGSNEPTEELHIFAKILSDEASSGESRELLLRTFGRVNIFKNEYNVLYSLIHDKPNIKITPQFIKLYLQANRAIYLNHADVHLINYKMGDNDEYAEFIDSTLNVFERAKRTKVSEGEFETAIEMLKMKFTTEQAVTLMEESLKIMTEGMNHRGMQYRGYGGMKQWLLNGLNKIDNVVEQSDKKGTFVVDIDYMNQNQEGALEKICDFGVPALDERLGGVYEGDMVTFLAPEKGFKTRISLRVIHTGVIQGRNSGVWALENGEKGIMAILRAIHFDYYYNKDETNPKKRKVIDPDWIRKGTVPEELVPLEWVSYQDLITNPAYGKIIIFDEDFDATTFTDTLEKAVKDHNMKLLLIDYLQLVPPVRGLDKTRAVGLAYQKSLQFLKRNKVGGVFPAQVTQDTIDYIDKKGADNLASLELRDIGAESAETLRTPDVLLFLYGTMEDILKCRIQIVGLPSRNSAPFPPIKTRVRPQVCDFTEVSSDMW